MQYALHRRSGGRALSRARHDAYSVRMYVQLVYRVEGDLDNRRVCGLFGLTGATGAADGVMMCILCHVLPEETE